MSHSGPGLALSVLATALLLAACTDSGGSGRRLPLTFRVAPVGDEAGFSAEAGAGVIVVRDRVLTGECHRREVHRARLRGDTVLLRIEHPRKGGACNDVGIGFGYEARIGGLPPGAYVLRVEYAGEVSSETEPGQAVERHVAVR